MIDGNNGIPFGERWEEGPAYNVHEGETSRRGNSILQYLVGKQQGEGHQVMRRNKIWKKKKRPQKKRRMVQLRLDINQGIEESIPYGTELSHGREKGMSIFFQNVNGILKEKGADLKDSLEVLDEVGAQYIGLTESLINERHEKAQRVKRSIVRHLDRNVHVT